MTTNQARARRILESMTNRWGKPATARDAAQALADAGLLAPEPRIIRTREELAALDPDAVVTDGILTVAATLAAPYVQIGMLGIPAVVLATGEQVRAARQALEEA